MSSKRAFVEAARRAGANISDLCREHGVSRPTGYKWLRRFERQGYRGLEELSRRPHEAPTATSDDVISAVLGLRDRHRKWGPLKIAAIVKGSLGKDGPSPSTVARILKVAGQSKRRRPPVRVWHVEGRPLVEVHGPNDLWTIDFKGWWRAKNKQRCEPLTVRDAFSRKVLAVVVVARANTAAVRRVLEKLFALYGVPKAMLMDNGAPWINVRARGGMTRLSTWLVSLGIKLHRSRIAKPQDNGAHERMHADLAELSLTPGRSRRHQQVLCDQWTTDFNHVRPHDALGGRTPAEVYGRPPPNPATVQIPTYPPGFITRRVRSDGSISMGGDVASLGRPFIGHVVGLQYVSGLRWRVCFFKCELGEIELCPHHILNTESPKTA